MKRDYVRQFSREEYKRGDRLIYKGIKLQIKTIHDNGNVCYIDPSITKSTWYFVVYDAYEVKIIRILFSGGYCDVNISEVQIDRTPNLIIRLWHKLIDLF